MILLWRCFANNVVQKSRYGSYNTYLFQINKGPFLRVQNRSFLVNGVRYRATDALGHVGKSKNVVLKNVITEQKKRPSDIKQLFMLVAPEKWRVLAAVTFLVVSSMITMVVPFSLGKLIDILYKDDQETKKINFTTLGGILLFVFFIGGFSNFMRVYLMSTAGYKVTQSLRKRVYGAILSQEVSMFDKRSTGELVGRLTGDAQIVSSAVTSNISDGLRSAIMSVAGVSMMFYVSPKLALVGLLTVPPTAAMAVIYGRFLKKVSKELQDSVASLNTTAEEKISNIRTVKAFAREKDEILKYSSLSEAVLKLGFRESMYKGMFFGMTGFSGNVIILSVLYYGGIMAADSAISVGSLTAFLMYAAYVGVAMNGLSSFYSELNKALGANDRLMELIHRQPAIPIDGGKVLSKALSGDVEYQNVNFAYPTRRDDTVLKNFSLKIDKNSMTAIVGSSGSGKSTIASLLLRLYDPDNGCVLLDNHDIKELDPVWVKSQIGFVSQEPILFSSSIKENIIYGNENATQEDVEDAAKQAFVTEFTDKMTDGLDTVIGERGITLSGGQRQRVAIARALIRKPKIFVLDEATSALDTESEHYIREAVEAASQERTVLTIAHRLSTVKNADKIVVLDKGQVVEIGTYNQLMQITDGFFKKLVQRQTFV